MIEAITEILFPLVEWCYRLVGNWWIAILLFTALTKVILLPLSLWSQRNSITMVELMPDLFRLKTRFYGDRETIEEKQGELYKERHYHPLLSLVPLAAQIIILLGLIGVIHAITDSGSPDVELLGKVPSRDGGVFWCVPFLAGLSSVIQGLAANRINPLQREQSRSEQLTTNGLSVGLSLFLGAFVVCGMAFYWICSNLMAVGVQLLCNIVIKPEKYVDYEALSAARSEYETLESSTAPQRKWYERDPYARKEKDDYKRFFSIEGKHLVFYSEGSGFYKYFKGAIEWLLNNSDVQIHYISSDPNDQVFGIAENEPRLLPYYIGQRRLITLMMKMDADVVVMSTPDLDNFYIKKSYTRKDITYVYMPHHTTSFHLVAGSFQAYEHFDEIFCVGQHQFDELRKEEELFGQKRKELTLIGYDLIDEEIRAYGQEEHEGAHIPPVVLVAPSWNPDNILDTCIDEMLEILLARGYRIIVRPHPEYTKRFRPKWEALLARHADIPEERLFFEKDFSSNSSILESDTIITDWSTVNLEFSFTTLKPSIFIDTPMKVNNPDWEQLGIMPTDISIRNEIGRSVAPDELAKLPEVIDEMLEHGSEWADDIAGVRSRMIANLGYGGERAGERILELVLEHQRTRAGKAGVELVRGDSILEADEPKHFASPEAGEPKHLASSGEHFSAGDVMSVLFAVLISTLLVPRPAFAYVDPSVMTYAIQAIAAVAVALSAVIGVAFRRTRAMLFKLLHIDERAGLLVESDVHRINPEQKADADLNAVQERQNHAAVARVRQVKVAWPIRLLLSLLAVGLLVFTVLVVAPIELVAANASSLVYGVDMVWEPLLFSALAITVLVALVLSLFRGAPFHILLALVTAFGIAAYLESLFFGRYLPVADGTPVVWENYAGVTFSSLTVWVALISGCVIFSIKKPQFSRSLGAVIASMLIVLQIAGIASLSNVAGSGTSVLERDDSGSITAENYQNVCTEYGLFTVSPHENVIVFVLDMTDTTYIRELLDGYYTDILDGLEGFTFFENSAGGMIPTRFGVPLLLTGSTPQPEQLLFDYIWSRYPDSSFLSDITELGYSIGLYSPALAVSDAELFYPATFSINNHDISESVDVVSANFNERGALAILYRCALYRHMPWAFKPSFWYYTDEVNQGMANTHVEQAEGDGVVYQEDDANYYRKLRENGLSFNDEDASFRFIHLVGTHWPYTLSRDGERVPEGTSRAEQCIGAFTIVKAYLEELRWLGIYEQTTVIIAADHGVWYPIDSDELEPIDRPTSPIIFVKPSQTAEDASKPCEVSFAPVTIVDLLPTILEAMGADEDMLASYGPDIYEWDEGDHRLRFFYMLDRKINEDGSSGEDEGLWEYVIDGDVNDFENWEFTGVIVPRDNVYYQERGIL